MSEETRKCVTCERKFIGVHLDDGCPYCRAEAAEAKVERFLALADELENQALPPSMETSHALVFAAKRIREILEDSGDE